MRVNVYSQELTKEITIHRKMFENGIMYAGIRFYLASPDVLHNTADDDDRSAITFWIPNAGCFNAYDLGLLFSKAANLAWEEWRKENVQNPSPGEPERIRDGANLVADESSKGDRS